MKEDNISQLGDYDVPFCEQQFTHGSCDISLFKFTSFDQLIPPPLPPPPPQTDANFRHLLSCDTIDINRQLEISRKAPHSRGLSKPDFPPGKPTRKMLTNQINFSSSKF